MAGDRVSRGESKKRDGRTLHLACERGTECEKRQKHEKGHRHRAGTHSGFRRAKSRGMRGDRHLYVCMYVCMYMAQSINGRGCTMKSAQVMRGTRHVPFLFRGQRYRAGTHS
eukprot:1159134-Pelagomonas_calceolata.AAC.9